MPDWERRQTTVVEGVAEVVDEDKKSMSKTKGGGVCNWTGTFRNPCFWILVGVGATLGFQYVFKKASK